jgi:hypothetical protein
MQAVVMAFVFSLFPAGGSLHTQLADCDNKRLSYEKADFGD